MAELPISDRTIWCGSYTSEGLGGGEGVVALAPRRGGGLEKVGVAAEAADASCLLFHPHDSALIYAVNEGGAAVQLFRRDREHSLTKVSEVPTSGTSPCSLAIGRTAWGGLVLYAACYGDGSVSVHPLADDGDFDGPARELPPVAGSGPDPSQTGPRAHAVAPVGPEVLVADLGTDRISVHRLTRRASETTASLELKPGTGPRDILRHPSGLIWVLGEHGLEISVVRRGGDGLSLLSSTPVAASHDAADKAAGLSLSADGRFAYVGLRGSNRLAVLSASPDGSALKPVGAVPSGGSWPRHHLLRGGLLHVANERSHDVASFEIDPRSGMPSPVGPPAPVPSPAYLL